MNWNCAKRIKLFTSLALLFLLLSIKVLPAAAETSISQVFLPLKRLTVVNESSKNAYLWLSGSKGYYFAILAGDSKLYTLPGEVYSYTLTSCEITISGTLDLTKHAKLVIPACGMKGGKGSKGAGVTDTSKLIKLVKVKFTNIALTSIIVVLDGPGDYVFSFKRGEVKYYTIPEGEYTYTLYACGTVKIGRFYIFPHKEINLGCTIK